MSPSPSVIVIGAGPAGLMAAEIIASAGYGVTVMERMPSVGRKFLMAGRGGLNLTHSEEFSHFLDRYGAARPVMEAAIAAFPPERVVEWCQGLGQETFVGSSGRVFPKTMKASPLLRAWLRRLEGLGVGIRTRQEWQGWDAAGALLFNGEAVRADAVVLALGGASWPRLGSDGGWSAVMGDIAVAPLVPSNCGFSVAWSDIFRSRFEGQPVKRIALRLGDRMVRGEALITVEGIEGGAVYALSGAIRDAIARGGPVTVHMDLRPDLTIDELARRVDEPRKGQSLSTFLRKSAGLTPIGVGLLQEALHAGNTCALAALIKAIPVTMLAARPIARAISSAGGIRLDEVDAQFMLKRRPGVFVAGEMLDWEAPTGGYLLQGAFSTGVAAGHGVVAWLDQTRSITAAMP